MCFPAKFPMGNRLKVLEKFINTLWFCFVFSFLLYLLFLITILFTSFYSQKANYVGSMTQSSTVCLGTGPGGDVYVPLKDLLPMVHPNDIVFDGTFDKLRCKS